MVKLLTCQQLCKEIGTNVNLQKIKDLSELITLSRTCNIGKPISFQKTEYCESELEILKKLLSWWCWLDENSNIEFRTKNITKAIQKNLIKSVKEEKTLVIYSVFCPSYKTGEGMYGYTGKVGERTKIMIDRLVDCIYQTQKLGFKVKGEVFFSDLLLENYELLANTEYKKDLDRNFEEFKKIIDSKDKDGIISTKLLSDIKHFKETIKECGILNGEIDIPKKTFELVLKRNLVFYQEKLGWNEKEVISRTEILARCYSCMGKEFKKMWPDGIMFWTESAYERAEMYNGKETENSLAIIFPQKT